eukprot:2430803-Amphidinium_carterae.1
MSIGSSTASSKWEEWVPVWARLVWRVAQALLKGRRSQERSWLDHLVGSRDAFTCDSFPHRAPLVCNG